MFVNSFNSASFFQKDSSNQNKDYPLIPYLLTPNKNIKIDSNEEQLLCFTEIIIRGFVYIFGQLL
tara:strand:- start:308 stop:502 length:195 start_codon:yes stop_codon:yes gene_type:complete